MRLLAFAYSLVGYAAFLGTFTFLMGFVTRHVRSAHGR